MLPGYPAQRVEGNSFRKNRNRCVPHPALLGRDVFRKPHLRSSTSGSMFGCGYVPPTRSSQEIGAMEQSHAR